MVLSKNGAGFTSLKGNSKQSCHFTKKHMEIAPFCIERSMVLAFFFIVLKLFILLSRSQNKACVTLDWYFILPLKNVAVRSNHAVINFKGNHFEEYFCQVFIFKTSSKIEIWFFWYRMRCSFKENISTNSLGQFWLHTIKIDAKK